jgi:methylated-DNA-[protein]-cysteine S-methyltransferase
MTALHTVLPTVIGPVNVAATEQGVVAIECLTPPELFVTRLERRLHATVRTRSPADNGPPADHLERAIAELQAYFERGSRTFDLPLDLAGCPDWDERVLIGVKAIPWGEVSSYGRIARRIGRAGAARAVGGAVGRNPVGIVIPCHRVIAGDGSIGGYGGAWWGSRERLLDVKRALLRLEGVDLPAHRFAD